MFCGGVLITLADLGYRTGVVDLTRGELASHGTPEERAREAEAASKVLGLALRENLGLPDGFLDPGPRTRRSFRSRSRRSAGIVPSSCSFPGSRSAIPTTWRRASC